jgi:triphosphatase
MDKPQNKSTETELKLIVSKADERRLADHAAFRPPHASAPKTERLVTTYFDTPNQDLARLGLSLRVRRAGGSRIQTIKSRGNGGGAATVRGEWEWPTPSDEPDLTLAAGTPPGDQLPPGLGPELQPVIVTDVVRTARTLEFEGATIEVALDSGSIKAGTGKESIHELELELREGRPAALYRLALELNAATPLAVEIESKAARGYRLKTGSLAGAVKASPVDLDTDVEAADGFRQIIANGLRHLLANRAAALAGDAEGVHQARIAIRRMRSALQLFEPRLEEHTTAAFERELRRIGRVVGEARDWDVFCLEALPKSFDNTEEACWGSLMREAADSRRRAAREASAREIHAASFTALVLGLSAWTESGRENRRLLGDSGLDRPLSDIAPKLLDRMDQKVNRCGRDIGLRAPAASLHPLRKSLKKLRYSVEFLSSFYPGKAAKAFLRRLKKLQKSLGLVNDAAAAITRAEQLADDGRADLAVAVGALALSQERACSRARRKLPRQWSAFEREVRFWR